MKDAIQKDVNFNDVYDCNWKWMEEGEYILKRRIKEVNEELKNLKIQEDVRKEKGRVIYISASLLDDISFIWILLYIYSSFVLSTHLLVCIG